MQTANNNNNNNEPVPEKTNNLGSDQVRRKPGCTVTGDGHRLEILDLESRGIELSVYRNKGADQLRSYCEADLRLCFRISTYANCCFFSMRWLRHSK